MVSPPSRGSFLPFSPIVVPIRFLYCMVFPPSPGLPPFVSLCWVVCSLPEGLVPVCPLLFRIVSAHVCLVLDGVPIFPRSYFVCLPFSSHMPVLDRKSTFRRSCLLKSPMVSPHMCLCWMACPPGMVRASPSLRLFQHICVCIRWCVCLPRVFCA